ncbi:MSP7-like protein [Plasmodium yoelii]|uniref:MSP7-like protein n=3 Tax=Plasmodium yoelii TaxID=5861 RepID=A0AAF0B898_PLAYO|nr:MSP7-like protein [Plasmodium yoelii]EAA21578.1 merozoite surface protein 7 precursor [Plasmodium yoelii yoelii]AAL08494.1 merozoite surface protein 7 precursor [Plasmodium yoelii]WBY60270.1 MSP7-like protein [Plasmodium yoelii yoelii]CDU20158.1 merozoite surface protein 7 [Plasmodium yoelii]VTZ80916.1 MSP7-like protein [Plasmodium yoelii]|eukprot:XP_730013.1 MSP7-like protein [Plasmodium yoelii]
MMAYKKLCFLAILALSLKAVSANDFSNNDDNIDDENVSDVINIFKNKNHDLYNNPNYISDIKKKFQLLKNQIDQMNKYEKGMSSGDIANILDEDSDDDSNNDEIVFGMSEEDLDNYDDDFWGQNAKKITPVQKGPDANGATLVEGNDEPQVGGGDQGGKVNQGAQVINAVQGGDGLVQGSSGDQVSEDPEPNLEKTAFLGAIFDEILKEQHHDDDVHSTEYHSKYNSLKNECDFPMNLEEYNIAKKLISSYFQSGSTENPIYLYDILLKSLKDEEYKKHFKNFIYGIYSFAKKYNYLSATRLAEANSQFIPNVLKALATVDLK